MSTIEAMIVPDVMPVPGTNLSDWIARHLGERIVRGELPPSTRLLEVRLAESLGVSRGPLREALRILNKQRLVDILPRRGAVVTAFGSRQIEQLYDVVVPLYQLLCRRTAESWRPDDLPPVYAVIEAMFSAAERHDGEGYYEQNFAFARACAPIVANPLLSELLADMEPLQRRVLYASYRLRKDALPEHQTLMRQLIRQVTERQAEAAGETVGRIGILEQRLARAGIGQGR